MSFTKRFLIVAVGVAFVVAIFLARSSKPTKPISHSEKNPPIAEQLEPSIASKTNFRELDNLTTDEKIKRYEALLVEHPKDISLMKHLAGTYREIEKYTEAVGIYERARLLAPNDTHLLERVCHTSVKAGQPDKAVSLVERFVASHPNEIQAYRTAADLYEALKLYEKAITACERAIELVDGQDHRVRYTIQLARIHSLRQDPAKAEDVLLKAMESSADKLAHHRLVDGLESFYKQSGQSEKITQRQETLLKESPQDVTLLQEAARKYAELGNFERSLELYKEARRLNPDNKHFLERVVTTCVKTGKIKEAISVIEKYVAQNPEDISGYRTAGDLYQNIKKYDKAIKAFDKASKLTENNDKRIRYSIQIAQIYSRQKKYRAAEGVLQQLMREELPRPEKDDIAQRLKDLHEQMEKTG